VATGRLEVGAAGSAAGSALTMFQPLVRDVLNDR
jgi:hypothetical protein